MKDNFHPIEIALVMGKNYVVSIYNEDIPVLDRLYEEFEEIEGKMTYPAQILYRIMDRCVDEYVQLVDHIEEKVETWEEAIYENPYAKISRDIFDLKRLTHKSNGKHSCELFNSVWACLFYRGNDRSRDSESTQQFN